ncbi:MAG: dihydrolipoamide acetyltransferase family protein [Candidatus Melainabacteria bacterium]
MVEFRLPDIGEGIAEGEIVQWLVGVGDTVAEDQPVAEVMTDKVTAEIPAPCNGVVKELRYNVGDRVPVGSVFIVFDREGAGAPRQEVAPQVAGTPASAPPTPTLPPQGGEGVPRSARPIGGAVLAAPATRKLARQLGVGLSGLTGSGPKGRITPQDVQAASHQSAPAASASNGKTATTTAPMTTPASSSPHPAKPKVTVAAGEDKRVPFAGMRRKIAEHLVHAKHTAPHFAYVDEVDMTALVDLRAQLKPVAEERGVKLTYLPLIIRAVIAGLKAFPVLNSQLDDAKNELVYKGAYNIGVAVATDDGLVVPVIHNADQYDLFELAAKISDLSDKARRGKLALTDIQGGTFTLTSIGSIGGLFGVPIINVPEVAILGINKIEPRAVVRDGAVVIREIMYLSLSCDHRVVDGAEGAQFANHVIASLQAPARLLV